MLWISKRLANVVVKFNAGKRASVARRPLPLCQSGVCGDPAGLFQRAVDRGELGVEPGAEAASAMPAAISPYSMAVAPVSSARNLQSAFMASFWPSKLKAG
jgi:hypothetical protein